MYCRIATRKFHATKHNVGESDRYLHIAQYAERHINVIDAAASFGQGACRTVIGRQFK